MKTLARFAASILATLALAADADPAAGQATPAYPNPVRSGYVESDGVRYWYEVHGQGEPLLLLHGGLGSIDMFGDVLPRLARSRQVIAVDLHGHGRTALGARTAVDYDAAGDDMAAILDALGYRQVDALGYSMGGGVALKLAARHPGRVRRLTLVSTGYATDGFYAAMRPLQAQVSAAMAPMMVETPMYRSYARVAPNPDEFPRLLDAMGASMRLETDWSEDVRGLAMPTMIVFGDSDMYRPEHIVEMYQLLGGGLRDAGWQRESMSRNRLAIIPDATHYDIFFSPLLVPVVLPFLDGASPAATWAEQVESSD